MTTFIISYDCHAGGFHYKVPSPLQQQKEQSWEKCRRQGWLGRKKIFWYCFTDFFSQLTWGGGEFSCWCHPSWQTWMQWEAIVAEVDHQPVEGEDNGGHCEAGAEKISLINIFHGEKLPRYQAEQGEGSLRRRWGLGSWTPSWGGGGKRRTWCPTSIQFCNLGVYIK